MRLFQGRILVATDGAKVLNIDVEPYIVYL